jgi:hypothetical protein
MDGANSTVIPASVAASNSHRSSSDPCTRGGGREGERGGLQMAEGGRDQERALGAACSPEDKPARPPGIRAGASRDRCQPT